MNYGNSGVTQKKKQLNSASRKIGTKLGVTSFKLLILCFVGAVTTLSCVGFGMFKGIIDSAPDVATIDVSPTGYATQIYDNGGAEIQSLVSDGTNRIYKTSEEIPVALQHAFVAIEDERFYEHNGIDIKGIIRAAYITVSNGDLSQGASTITQQLLKNNVFNAYNESTSEKIKRKIQEQYLAIKLETYMDKQSILENYLNTINLGNGYYGVGAAAGGYFGKDVSELTLSECAVIAAITQNPTGYNPVRYPDKNKSRQQTVLNYMYEQHYITKDELDEALADDVYARIQDIHDETDTSPYSYFVDELIDQVIGDLVAQYGYTETQASNIIYSNGLQIYSTQDTQMQSIADTVLNDPGYYGAGVEYAISYALSVKAADGKITNYSHQTMQNYYQKVLGKAGFGVTYTNQDTARAEIEEYKSYIIKEGDTIIGETLSFTVQPQVSFSLIDQHTGYVKVLVGGRGDKTGNRTLNRATNTARQPGSSIKPLAVYAPAIDIGSYTLATPIDDAPYYYGGEEPQLVTNFTKGQYLGFITLREALTRSQNVPAVKVLTSITPQIGYNYLEKFGISTLVSPKAAINGYHDVVQALALGGMTKGVTNIDMCSAYASIANKGTYTKPVYYTKVYDHDGNLILDNSVPETHQVLKESTAWLITDAMKDVVESPLGTAAYCRLDNQPVAGKTGTTNFNGDLWFCGFTPYYTGAIWIGYDDNSVLKINTHRQMWAAIMKEIHANLETGTFGDPPESIVPVEVCSQSGKLPVEGLCDSDERGSQIITEYFAVDNQPTESCDTHVKVTICLDSNLPATAGCTRTVDKIYIKKDSTGAIIPEGAESYSTRDEAYVLPSAFANAKCSLHRNTTSNSSGTTSGTTNKTSGTTNGSTSLTTGNNTSATQKPASNTSDDADDSDN